MTIIAYVQSVYFLVTGIWPIVSINTFQKVTGPKQDLWLVKTVGGMVTVMGAALLLAAVRGEFPPPVLALAIGGALCFATVDVVYVTKRIIGPVYLWDAAAELAIVAAWILALATQ